MQLHKSTLSFIALISLSFLFQESYASNDYQSGYIVYKTGEHRAGYIRLFYCSDTKIHFKKELNYKKEKINNNELEEIALIYESDTLVFHKYKLGKYNAFCTRIRNFDGHCWATKIYTSDQIEAFQYISKHGDELHTNIASFASLNLANTFSRNMFVNFREPLTFGIKFPDQDRIIDLYSCKGGYENLKGRKLEKRMIKYLSKHCNSFKKAIKTEAKPPKDFMAFLNYYTEICP